MRRKQLQTRSLPPIRGVATLSAETIDRGSRTVEMTFYSGAPVYRMPFFDDPYELEFEVTRKAAKLERLNGGAPLMNSHQTYAGVDAILGVVEKAWIADGQGRAKVRFSKRADVEPIWQDVLDGVIRNVSMGTYILAMSEVTDKGSDVKRFRATSWEPYEISLVGVPADAGAQVMEAGDAKKRPCRINFSASASAEAINGAEAPKEHKMRIKVRLLDGGEIIEIEEREFDAKLHSEDLAGDEDTATPAPKREKSDPKAAKHAVDDAIERDAALAAQVKRAATAYGLDAVWARRHINLGTGIEQVIELAAEERAKRAPKEINDIGFGDDQSSSVWRREQMELALVARASRKAPPESAQQYAHASFTDLAYECLGWNGKQRGVNPRDSGRIMELSLHTGSDFPLLLANALNKIMLPVYETAQPTYRMIAARKTFKDFRPHRFQRVGDFPIPLAVGEHGEYKYGTMGENEELVSLLKFGRIFGITYESLVNDDVGAFNDLATAAARRTVDFENATFFSTCLTAGAGLGPTLLEGSVAVYNSAHANIATGGALTNTQLGSARALMMAQTSIDGLKLNTPASFLLVSPASLTLAETLTAPLVPNIYTSVNPFAGRLTTVGDANLTGVRGYVLSDPGVGSNYIYGFLGTANGPRTEVRSGFTTDGMEFKLSLEFGCGSVDYRFGVTFPGV